MTGPRIYVEAAERFARDAGYRPMWSDKSMISRNRKCLWLCRDGSLRAACIPVTAGTISLTDALRILRGVG